MLTEAVQRLESRFEELVETYKKLKVENDSLKIELDGLLREREFTRTELDRILSRFEQLGKETS